MKHQQFPFQNTILTSLIECNLHKITQAALNVERLRRIWNVTNEVKMKEKESGGPKMDSKRRKTKQKADNEEIKERRVRWEN